MTAPTPRCDAFAEILQAEHVSIWDALDRWREFAGDMERELSQANARTKQQYEEDSHRIFSLKQRAERAELSLEQAESERDKAFNQGIERSAQVCDKHFESIRHYQAVSPLQVNSCASAIRALQLAEPREPAERKWDLKKQCDIANEKIATWPEFMREPNAKHIAAINYAHETGLKTEFPVTSAAVVDYTKTVAMTAGAAPTMPPEPIRLGPQYKGQSVAAELVYDWQNYADALRTHAEALAVERDNFKERWMTCLQSLARKFDRAARQFEKDQALEADAKRLREDLKNITDNRYDQTGLEAAQYRACQRRHMLNVEGEPPRAACHMDAIAKEESHDQTAMPAS